MAASPYCVAAVVAGPDGPEPVDPVDWEIEKPRPVEPVEPVVEVEDVVDVVAVGPVVDVADDAEVDVPGVAVSGETHPAGGAVAPCCPGMRTVPAQPKSENVTVSVWVAPSLNAATDTVSRMYPASSIDTLTVVPV